MTDANTYETFQLKLRRKQKKHWEASKLPDETLSDFIRDAVDEYCYHLDAKKHGRARPI